MADAQLNGGRRLAWNNQVSLGNVLTIISMLAAAVAIWSGKEADIATLKAEIVHLGRLQQAQDTLNAQQDARWQVVLGDLKADLRELRAQIDQLLQQRREGR